MDLEHNITPTSIAVVPNIGVVELPDYDFAKQKRGDVLMNWTANTEVTIGNDGQPRDAKGDTD